MSGDGWAEGFLCPLCKADLGSQDALEGHFAAVHSEKSTGGLSFLGKAAAKVSQHLGFQGDSAPGEPAEDFSYLKIPGDWEPQSLGKTRNYSNVFRKLRKERTNYIHIQHNQLLMRLEKLLYSGPQGSGSKRKEYEQTVVDWLDEKLVPSCPDCHKSFGLFRRCHHCRLCGAVLCSECSKYLLVEAAVQVLAAVAKKHETGTASSRRKKAGSRAVRVTDDCFRICDHCEHSLEQTNSNTMKKQAKSRPPPVVQLYEMMAEAMRRADTLLPPYYRLLARLQSTGDVSVYEQAGRRRAELLEVLHRIDSLSKKISGLNAKKMKKGSGSFKLQHSIRSLAAAYLTNNMVALQDLPSKERLAELREKRAADKARRQQQQERARLAREEERRKAREAAERKQQQQQPQRRAYRLSSESESEDDDDQQFNQPPDDIIEEQRRRLKQFIADARAAGKHDEVEMLETQLRVFEEYNA